MRNIILNLLQLVFKKICPICLSISGSFKELQQSGLDFTKILGEGENESEDDTPERELVRQGSSKSIHSHEASIIPEEVEEQKSTGSVGSYVYRAYFKAGGNCCIIFMLFFLFIVAQLFGSAADYFISYW